MNTERWLSRVLLAFYRPHLAFVLLVTKLAKRLGFDEDQAFATIMVVSIWMMIITIVVLGREQAMRVR